MRSLLALLLLASAALGQGSVSLHTELRPAEPAWVGQRVSFYVTVTMSERPEHSPRFDLPSVEGALLLQAPGSPVLGSERVDGVEHTTQRFELMLFAQRPGEIAIGAVDVRVTLGGEEQRQQTAPFTLTARLPEGAQPGLPLITSSKVTIEQRWDPEPGAAKAGDAFKRTVTIRATNVLGLAIPPLPVPSIDGLGVYSDAPTVDDRMSRGQLTSTRSDTITIVCEQAGTYPLPSLVYRWWNPERLQMESQTLPGVQIQVAVGPPVAGEVAGDVDGSNVGGWISLALFLLLSAVPWVFRRRLASSWRAWQVRRWERESAYFQRLLRACRGGDAAVTWRALTAWMERASRAGDGSAREFALSLGVPEAIGPLEDLQRATLQAGVDWEGAELAEALVQLRGQIGNGDGLQSGSLRALNPTRMS